MSSQSRKSQLRKSGQRLDILEHEASKEAELKALQTEGYGRTSARGLSPKVLMLIMGGILLIIGIPMWLILGAGMDGAGEAKQGAPARAEPAAVEPAAVEPAAADEAGMTSLSEEDVARSFLEAKSWEERRGFVRDADTVSGHLDAYPEEVKAFPVPIVGLRSMGAVMPDGLIRYERFAVRMTTGGMRFLCVVQTEHGPRVDYDAFARYSSVSWEELLEGRPAREVRVMVQRDTYFNHVFANEEKLSCFKLTSPDWPKTVWGYVPSESITARLLSGIVSVRPQRLTISLRSENGSHRDLQFVIDDVLANGWIRTSRDPEDIQRLREGL